MKMNHISRIVAIAGLSMRAAVEKTPPVACHRGGVSSVGGAICAVNENIKTGHQHY